MSFIYLTLKCKIFFRKNSVYSARRSLVRYKNVLFVYYIFILIIVGEFNAGLSYKTIY